jgi:hypothetical protein
MEDEKTLRIMAVGGQVEGNQEHDRSWTEAWREALSAAVCRWDPELAIEFEFIAWDDLFAPRAAGDEPLMEHLWTILGADWPIWLRRQRVSARKVEHVRNELRRVAQAVVAWMSDERARVISQTLLSDRLRAFQPDVLCAQGVGSLLAYDALSRRPAAKPWPLTLVTFGSPIGNTRVQSKLLGGRAAELPVRHWYYLYNRHDDGFAARLRLDAANYTQIDAPFRAFERSDFTAAAYLAHSATTAGVWRVLFENARLDRCRLGGRARFA